MDIANSFKAYFRPFTMMPIQVWHDVLKLIAPNPPILLSTVSLDFPSPQVPASLDPKTTLRAMEQHVPAVIRGQHSLEWTELIIVFCFSSTIEIAVQSAQTTNSQHLPLLHLLVIAISLAFASLFVTKFIDSKFHIAAISLERAGVLFAATAFFLACSMPFSLYIKCTTWAIYATSLLVIFVCNQFKLEGKTPII